MHRATDFEIWRSSILWPKSQLRYRLDYLLISENWLWLHFLTYSHCANLSLSNLSMWHLHAFDDHSRPIPRVRQTWRWAALFIFEVLLVTLWLLYFLSMWVYSMMCVFIDSGSALPRRILWASWPRVMWHHMSSSALPSTTTATSFHFKVNYL